MSQHEPERYTGQPPHGATLPPPTGGPAWHINYTVDTAFVRERLHKYVLPELARYALSTAQVIGRMGLNYCPKLAACVESLLRDFGYETRPHFRRDDEGKRTKIFFWYWKHPAPSYVDKPEPCAGHRARAFLLDDPDAAREAREADLAALRDLPVGYFDITEAAEALDWPSDKGQLAEHLRALGCSSQHLWKLPPADDGDRAKPAAAAAEEDAPEPPAPHPAPAALGLASGLLIGILLTALRRATTLTGQEAGA